MPTRPAGPTAARVKTKSSTAKTRHRPRLIESDAFPLEFLSTVARRESWRKEIYRPVYHVHKWWAKRLGSTFRGILLGCLLPDGSDLEHAFYKRHDFSGASVFDPFMGSGTTVGEAHKLGFTALGRDINPVACESVRVALGPLGRDRLRSAFSTLSGTVGQRLLDLYRAGDEDGQTCDVLYYFWVKYVRCPHCTINVDLFPTRIVARNAYPNRKPQVRVCCPRCGDIFPALNSDKLVDCRSCGLAFDPHTGPASGTKATCTACSRSFSIAHAVRASGHPPLHRLYGKLLLTPEGEKRYLPATPEDVNAYQECSGLLRRELERETIRLPEGALADGFNTRQALGYNYRAWRDFFNDRQLLALGWLQDAIARLPEPSTRDALLTLFSGVLEFNNLFASYKGEGTGAVRHMFSHHILKPERMPVEANVWGTAKSSGSFSTLFRSRLLRALDYRSAPFEVITNGPGKASFSSAPFSGRVRVDWPTEGRLESRGIYLSCGSSDETGLPDECMDFVVTDPPFFDNVHYSELADFFYAWQSLYRRGFLSGAPTTRHPREVQDADAGSFATKLRAVFEECRRVLKEDGLLVFTYHHSRVSGWVPLVEAVFGAGFSVVNAHPVKSEMSVATPKARAKEPIQLDVVLVCKRREQDPRVPFGPIKDLDEVVERAHLKLARLASIGLDLSGGDRQVAVVSQLIAALGPVVSAETAVRALLEHQTRLARATERPPDATAATSKPVVEAAPPQQMAFLLEPTASKSEQGNRG